MKTGCDLIISKGDIDVILINVNIDRSNKTRFYYVSTRETFPKTAGDYRNKRCRAPVMYCSSRIFIEVPFGVRAAEIISVWGIREPLSMLSHLSGALLAVAGLFILLRRATQHGLSRKGRAGLIAYGCSIIFAFSASALFHYFPRSADELVFFKKLDHAAIFLVIAGTCTVLLNAGQTSYRRELITACWLITCAALILKMLVWPMQLWLSAAVYLTVGWIGAMSVLKAMRHVSWDKLRLLVHGLVIFTAAAVVFATESPVLWQGVVEGHELFHLMVLAGALMHFAFVLRYCTVPDALCSDEPARSRPAISLAADSRGN